MAKKIKKKKVVVKKKAVKKTAKKKTLKAKVAKKKRVTAKPKIQRRASKAKPAAKPKEEVIEGALLGKVEDYYGHVGVIAMNLGGELSVGDTIRIKGHTTDITQRVESMQINHVGVTSAKTGDAVGIKANDKCRKGDKVYKI